MLLAILAGVGLGKLDNGMLELRGKDILIKTVDSAIHEQFLDVRTKELSRRWPTKLSKLRCAPASKINSLKGGRLSV